MSAHEIIADKDFDLNRFFGWVKAHARFEILENTEEDHIFVYKLYGNLILWSIRHRNAGDQTFYIVHPQVMLHYEAMLSGKDFPTKERLRLGKTKVWDPWTQKEVQIVKPTRSPKNRRKGGKAISKKRIYGPDCFYCGRDLGGDVTLEHLVPKARGGQNHAANLRLAHAKCNNFVGSMSLEAKARLFPGPFTTVDMELLRYLQANDWKDPT
jgi:hypothetical protein